MFPTIIDNSMREAFVACPMKFYYGYIRELDNITKSVHLVAGGAFARGLEVLRRSYYEQGMSQEDALVEGVIALIIEYGDFDPPELENKTCYAMIASLIFYVDEYQLSADHVKPAMFDGIASLEFSFAIPLPITHPDTGEAIIYVGRFDMFGKLQGSTNCVHDDKTAGQLGKQWSAKWKLASQFTGYTWAANRYGHDSQTVIVRGISVLKSSNGTAESITYRPKWMVDRWYAQLLREIARMIDAYKTGLWDLNQSDSCAAYGGCKFIDLCTSQEPEDWIACSFVHKPYNPLNVGD